jgi:hypothetical protein
LGGGGGSFYLFKPRGWFGVFSHFAVLRQCIGATTTAANDQQLISNCWRKGKKYQTVRANEIKLRFFWVDRYENQSFNLNDARSISVPLYKTEKKNY